jgi:hypothetical protein
MTKSCATKTKAEPKPCLVCGKSRNGDFEICKRCMTRIKKIGSESNLANNVHVMELLRADGERSRDRIIKRHV